MEPHLVTVRSHRGRVIDWDQAEPGDPAYDTGFLAWFIVPVMTDEKAHARGFSSAPDRMRRLKAFAEGSGRSPAVLLSEIERAQLEFIRRVTTRGTGGVEGHIWTTLLERGFHESASADHTYLRETFPV